MIDSRPSSAASSLTVTRYEIHIPDGDGTRIERVHGDNWLDALRRGLAAAGRPAPTRNLGVSFAPDSSVDIVDGETGEQYKVAPIPEGRSTTGERPAANDAPVEIEDPVDDPFADEDEGGAMLARAPAGPMLARAPSEPPARRRRPITQPTPTPSRRAGGRGRLSAKAWGPYRQRARSAPDAPARPGAIEVSGDEHSSDEHQAVPNTGNISRNPQGDSLGHDARALDDFDGDIIDASSFLLDRAMHHVPSAAGSVLLIDPRYRCLYFAAARGEKADALVSQRVPLEVGLAGHCLRTRKSLNIVEPARDPRFARSIADKVGYVPRSIVCLPIISGKRIFGVLELLDREGRETFATSEETTLRRAARRLGDLIARQLGL